MRDGERKFELWRPSGLFVFGCNFWEDLRKRAVEESRGRRFVWALRTVDDELIAEFYDGMPLFEPRAGEAS